MLVLLSKQSRRVNVTSISDININSHLRAGIVVFRMMRTILQTGGLLQVPARDREIYWKWAARKMGSYLPKLYNKKKNYLQ